MDMQAVPADTASTPLLPQLQAPISVDTQRYTGGKESRVCRAPMCVTDLGALHTFYLVFMTGLCGTWVQRSQVMAQSQTAHSRRNGRHRRRQKRMLTLYQALCVIPSTAWDLLEERRVPSSHRISSRLLSNPVRSKIAWPLIDTHQGLPGSNATWPHAPRSLHSQMGAPGAVRAEGTQGSRVGTTEEGTLAPGLQDILLLSSGRLT